MLKMMIISLLITSAVCADAAPKPKPGDWARYGFVLAKQDAKPFMEDVTIAIGGAERGLLWWEMAVKKPGGATFAIRVLSERVPMTGSSADIGRVERYLFRDGDRPFVEYKDKSTGKALLPEFDFRERLLPRRTSGTTYDGAFATTGTYLGHGVQLLETGSGKAFAASGETKLLTLDPTLIIGTGRCFRDIDVGRVAGRNYDFRNFTAEEYDEMEAAGVNFFIVDTSEREAMVCERPAFYTKYPVFADFPNILYRSNYRGAMMFTDEPAVLTNFAECRHVTAAENLLRQRVAASLLSREHYSPLALPARLESEGVSLGTWSLAQRDIPAWEAAYCGAFDEMAGGVSGVIHEGRYDLKMFNGLLNGVCGPGYDVNTEQMLLMHYAFLRGAARCFNGAWGTSIYGQADPAISPTALKLAYDLGARYLWFWTSDHGHHMPYHEQLELTRTIRKQEREHPRQPIAGLLRQAKVALVFPEGYIGWSEYWPNGLWNNERFALDKTNDKGVTYRSVLSAALKQAVLLARQGAAFDVVVDGDAVRKAGYSRLIRVRTDGTVLNGLSSETRDRPGVSGSGKLVLDGIPRAGYNIHLNPFCGSLFAVLQYIKDPQDYDYLMGISGAAFRRLYNRDDGGNIDLMHYAPEPARHTFEALGYSYGTVPMDKGKMAAAIKESVSRGMPVLAHGIIGPPEIGIVSGYESDGEVLFGYSYFQDPSIKGYYRKEKWWEKTKDNDPRGALVIGDKKSRPSPLNTLISTLTLAVDLARKPAWPGIKDHSNGLAAYEDWAKDTELDAIYPTDKPDALATRLMIHGDQCVMLDERKHAAKFLRNMTEAAPPIADDLSAAADLYDQVFGQMGAIWPWGDGDMGPERAKALADHSTRVGIAAGIRRARDVEIKAVEHLEKALAKLRAEHHAGK